MMLVGSIICSSLDLIWQLPVIYTVPVRLNLI